MNIVGMDGSGLSDETNQSVHHFHGVTQSTVRNGNADRRIFDGGSKDLITLSDIHES